MVEEWRELPRFRDYEVSNFGRVRTRARKKMDSRGGVRSYKSRIVKAFKCQAGFMMVNVFDLGKRRSIRVHRFVAQLYLPKPKLHQREVAHIDGNKCNNRRDNLLWVTKVFGDHYLL